MKNHVVSLELAQELKKAGYPQESEFYWNHVSNFGDGYTWEIGDIPAKESYAAPLATELLEQLPASVEDEEFGLAEIHIYKQTQEEWLVIYDTEEGTILSKDCKNESLPDALAEMYLYLKNENLL